MRGGEDSPRPRIRLGEYPSLKSPPVWRVFQIWFKLSIAGFEPLSVEPCQVRLNQCACLDGGKEGVSYGWWDLGLVILL